LRCRLSGEPAIGSGMWRSRDGEASEPPRAREEELSAPGDDHEMACDYSDGDLPILSLVRSDGKLIISLIAKWGKPDKVPSNNIVTNT
jgi:hypothetical protein